MPDTTCFYTTIKNSSGAPLIASFIPPHGKTMAANEDVTVFGDIWDQLGSGGRNCVRLQTALEYAVLHNMVEIVRSPNIFLYNLAGSNVKSLAVSAGVLGIIDPCYGSYNPV